MRKLMIVAAMASTALFASPLQDAFDRLETLNPALEDERTEIKEILLDLYKNHQELFDGSRCLLQSVKTKDSKTVKKLCLEK